MFEYPSSQLRGGYLEKEGHGWAIRPARKFCGESFVHVDYKACSWAGQHPGKDYGSDDIIRVFVKPVIRSPRSKPKLALNLACIASDNNIKKKTSRSNKPVGFEEGVLVRSGHISRKHMHCVIYEKDANAELIPIPRKMWKLYEEDRNLTRGIPTRKLCKPDDPLFYLIDPQGNLEFWGPTMMFRLPYQT